MAFTARAGLLAAVFGLVPGTAAAQAAGVTGTSSPSTPATSAEGAPTAPTAPAESAPPAAPVIPATGYGWSTTPKKHVTGGRAPRRARADSVDAVLPGFETLADGSSRLFVQLSRAASYDTRTAAGAITYVLKGVHVDRRNNTNPLVTVHFNTPVTSAKLVPHGPDLWFVVDLRAKVQPTVTMDAAKDGAAMLRIEFPKGDYLPASTMSDGALAPTTQVTGTAPVSSAAPAPGAAPTPQRSRRHRPAQPKTEADPSSP